jgi:hypothetical protein
MDVLGHRVEKGVQKGSKRGPGGKELIPFYDDEHSHEYVPTAQNMPSWTLRFRLSIAVLETSELICEAIHQPT